MIEPIRFKIHPAQQRFLRSSARFRAFVGGRGTGKSYIGSYDMIRRAKPGRLYMMTAPTYPMLFDATFRSFLAVGQKLEVIRHADVKRSAPPQIKLRTGAEILFRSADDPERLRGPNLSGAFMDEASQTELEAYQILLATLREAGEMGWLTAGFTPRGKQHWTYNTFGENNPDAELVHCATKDNPFLPAEFFETVERQYGQESWLARQELGGLFVEPEGCLIRRDWFRRFQWIGEPGPAFDGLIVLETGRHVMRKNINIVVVCDPSLGKEHSDNVAIGAFALIPEHRLAAALHITAAKIPVDDIPTAINRIAKDWNADAVHFEADGFQVTVAKLTAAKCACPVRQISHEKKKKVVRALPAIEMVHTGGFLVPERAPWLEAYLSEVCEWSGADDQVDDQVDITAYCVREFMRLVGDGPDDGPFGDAGKTTDW